MISQVTSEEKALLTTGADSGAPVRSPAFGFPASGCRTARTACACKMTTTLYHLGLGRSLPATCFPPAVTLASILGPAAHPQCRRGPGSGGPRPRGGCRARPGGRDANAARCAGGTSSRATAKDPLLTSRLAGAMVRGLQSQGVGACLKHFACNTQETDRLRVSADVDERALREIYLRAFEVIIRESNPWVIMSAYNRINGVFASENPWLLTDVLREEWGYDGLVLSDWGAVHDPVEAVAAGLDLRMPGQPDDSRVRDALADGQLDEAVVDRVVERLRLLASHTEDSRETKPVVELRRPPPGRATGRRRVRGAATQRRGAATDRPGRSRLDRRHR